MYPCQQYRESEQALIHYGYDQISLHFIRFIPELLIYMRRIDYTYMAHIIQAEFSKDVHV